MQSKTSFFNPTLFWKNVTRFWPIWGSYLVIWAFLLPISLPLAENGGSYYGFGSFDDPLSYFAQVQVLKLGGAPTVVFALLYGLVSAMALFSYLFQSRSVDLMHALPIRREGLFLTQYLSGLAFTLVPAAAVALATLVVEITLGCAVPDAIGVWLLHQSCASLFFYSFAVFCAMFTGNLVALPVFYGVLNVLTLGVYGLMNEMFRSFVYGLSGFSSGFLTELVYYLSPAVYLFLRYETPVTIQWEETAEGLEQAQVAATVSSLPLLCYAAAGLVLAALALLLYRRRQSERAGDIVSVAPVKPVFQYGVAFCAALVAGIFLYGLFQGVMPHNGWSMLLFLIIGGAVGYTAAAMLLKKTFRVFQARFFAGLGALALALTGGIAVMELDLTGFERWVPAREEVLSVSLDLSGYVAGSTGVLTFEGTEEVEAVLDIHRDIVAQQQEPPEGSYYTIWVKLEYSLANGSFASRRYDLYYPLAQEEDSSGPLEGLKALLGSPAGLAARYPLLFDGEKSPRTVELSFYALSENQIFSGGDALALEAAIREDLTAGRLGTVSWDSQELSYAITLWLEYPGKEYNESITFYLQPSATATLAALEDLGLGDAVRESFEMEGLVTYQPGARPLDTGEP